ncbi:hypothetical protein PGT21_015309 [Puccinia graminis f. sp. tritici]|uniref:Uncharacterized protein n=1 Tax=Puccinia graminis f. sp. tritici TaxID=56615 RepID=A0A5B0R256_PUCGR|nr:hypothetical protein PGT21_015309 [Puccinia graminis f. sp. tritici]
MPVRVIKEKSSWDEGRNNEHVKVSTLVQTATRPELRSASFTKIENPETSGGEREAKKHPYFWEENARSVFLPSKTNPSPGSSHSRPAQDGCASGRSPSLLQSPAISGSAQITLSATYNCNLSDPALTLIHNSSVSDESPHEPKLCKRNRKWSDLRGWQQGRQSEITCNTYRAVGYISSKQRPQQGWAQDSEDHCGLLSFRSLSKKHKNHLPELSKEARRVDRSRPTSRTDGWGIFKCWPSMVCMTSEFILPHLSLDTLRGKCADTPPTSICPDMAIPAEKSAPAAPAGSLEPFHGKSEVKPVQPKVKAGNLADPRRGITRTFHEEHQLPTLPM